MKLEKRFGKFDKQYLKVYSLMVDQTKPIVSGADHDIIWLASESNLKPLTDDDIVYLQRCGIHWDSESDCLANFC